MIIIFVYYILEFEIKINENIRRDKKNNKVK